MAGIVGMTASSGVPEQKFASSFYWQISYIQHLGEKYSGVAILDKEICSSVRRGLFRSCFHAEEMKGKAGIGYCGTNEEPFFGQSKFGPWATCFSGNVINSSQLRKEFMDNGAVFKGGDDAELMMMLISQKPFMVEGLKFLAEKIKGSYSLLILTPEGIYVALSPDGRWPLILGRKDGKAIVASETGGFDNFDFKVVRDLDPGEIGLLKDGKWETEAHVPSKRIQICSFLWAYTAFPNARIRNVPASLVRRNLGFLLAEKDIRDEFIPHMVSPVPDSGRFHALGYYQRYCYEIMRGRINRIPLFYEQLLRYRFSGRSFLRSTQEKRQREAFIKIVKGGESLDDVKEILRIFRDLFGDNLNPLAIALVEDSVVRGTQVQENLIPKIKGLGFKEVHIRASFPELKSHCPWGKTTKKEELLAVRFPSIEERERFLGVDSLRYNEVEDLFRAIGLPQKDLCVDCTRE